MMILIPFQDRLCILLCILTNICVLLLPVQPIFLQRSEMAHTSMLQYIEKDDFLQSEIIFKFSYEIVSYMEPWKILPKMISTWIQSKCSYLEFVKNSLIISLLWVSPIYSSLLMSQIKLVECCAFETRYS